MYQFCSRQIPLIGRFMLNQTSLKWRWKYACCMSVTVNVKYKCEIILILAEKYAITYIYNDHILVNIPQNENHKTFKQTLWAQKKISNLITKWGIRCKTAVTHITKQRSNVHSAPIHRNVLSLLELQNLWFIKMMITTVSYIGLLKEDT
jgi:hypothetical protein